MNKLIKEFNTFFNGSAEIVVREDRLEITIDSQTLILSLPEVIGGQSNPRD